MSDEKRPVPTRPGWWMLLDPSAPVVFIERVIGQTAHYRALDHDGQRSVNRPEWLREIRADDVPKAEADALRERAERAEQEVVVLDAKLDEANDALADTRAERDRYREAVGRLREALSGLLDCYGHHDDIEDDRRAVDALAATTDEAIQGYPEPSEPDAALVAKANAALVAEVEALRAERDAAARDADGLRFVAFETEKALGEALTALDLFATLAEQVGNVKAAALGRVLDAREKASANNHQEEP